MLKVADIDDDTHAHKLWIFMTKIREISGSVKDFCKVCPQLLVSLLFMN